MIRIDQFSPLRRILFREQSLEGDLDEVHVAKELFTIGKCKLERFSAGMNVFGAVVSHRLEIVAFEDV